MVHSRGQSDIQTLLVFIVGVTLVLAVVPAALGLAGMDVRDGPFGDDSSTPDEDEELDDGALLVLSNVGSGIDDDRTSVGVVELVVAPLGGAVEMDNVTVTWDGADSYELTPSNVGTGDASFTIETTSGESELTSGDRAVLRFDLGTDDLDTQRFGDRLEPGDAVTVTITTGDGVETTESFTVPDPLPPGNDIRLV